MRRFILIIFSCIVSLTAQGVQAQDSSDDLFNLLDTTAPQDTTEQRIWGKLRSNTSFQFINRTMFSYQKAAARPGLDNATLANDSRLEMTTGFTQDMHQFGISAWLEYGSQKDTYSQNQYTAGITRSDMPVERQRRIFEVNELFWILSAGGMDATFGKKPIPLGLAPLYSPVDRLNPLDLNDPMNSKMYGIWQARLDYYRKGVAYSVAVLPLFSPPKTPGERSRWRITDNDTSGTPMAGDFQFFDQTAPATAPIEQVIPDGARQSQVISRVKATVAGWDLMLAGFTGVGPYPVLREGNPANGEAPVIREYIRTTNANVGFSTAWSKAVVHGEALVQWRSDGKDDDYLAAVGGVAFTIDERAQQVGIEKIEIITDYAHEVIINRQNRAGYIASSGVVRIGQNDILIRATVQANTKLHFESFVNLNLDDNGHIFAPQIRYRPRDGLWLTLGTEFFGGKADSFYGRWEKNDRLVVTIDYSF